MDKAPFSTFRPEMIDRFEAQIVEAWARVEVPIERIEGAPCDCPECDEPWAWVQRMPGRPVEDLRLAWPITWSLLAPGGRVYVLGKCLLFELKVDPSFNNVEDALGLHAFATDRYFTELYALLTARQRWCTLKMLIWSYLEDIQGVDLNSIIRLRSEMGFHGDWPRPRLRPPT